ncbi:DNA repair protein RAD16 [Cladobotryum mycophilum]|uniref:DNA repair protein RAD16 n=1 Tax=Cladobotryum mycophilum TaxID=491253 RepID=A0ABR0SPC0_9HYPO
MPRGRPPRRGTVAPSSERPASLESPAEGVGRSTRSRKAPVAPTSEPSPDPLEEADPKPLKALPRTRATRASLRADIGNVSAASLDATAVAPRRLRGRQAKASAMNNESGSSLPTSLAISSESDYSTPGTSKLPSPAAQDYTAAKASAIEVRIPARGRLQATDDTERASRSSIYAMSSKPRNAAFAEIGDSDEDEGGDDFTATSRDAKVALRLQKEEYGKGAQPPTLAPNRRSNRSSVNTPSTSASTSAEKPTKRGRALTGPNPTRGRPAKKSKIVADSEESSLSDIDMDAEIAAGVAFRLKAPSLSDDGISNIEDEADGPSDDELLDATDARATKVVQAAGKAVAPAKSSRNNTIANSDSEAEDSADLLSNDSDIATGSDGIDSATASDSESVINPVQQIAAARRGYRRPENKRRHRKERDRLEEHHPELKSMWTDLENMPVLKAGMAPQPQSISRQLKPFQLEGLAWMKEMEKLEWKGGLLGDEMGLGKTIQAVSLIMSDYPAKQPSLVLVPPVALMQWQSEINSYTDGTLKTFVFHGTNQKVKTITVKELKKFDVIMMSYNSLESMYRKQEKGFKRKNGIHKEKSLIHSINFHRIMLDEAHCIKTRTTMTAKACFALKTEYRWCLTGTPLQNRIGELFSLIRFLNIRPFASYLCKQCPCSTLEWSMDENSRCSGCKHAGMQHVSVFNQELLNPIQKFGNLGPGRAAFQKLRLMTDRIMLRRLKKDHTNSMELPVKEIYVDRQFFGEEENDFANSIMTNGQRRFDTYVAQGVLLNNYANIFGLIMQMRQVADHPDLILKKNAEGGQNVLVCCICDEPAEDTIRSRCKHDFCRACVSSYVSSTDTPDCPRCHIPLSIDLEQPEIEQDEAMVKKSSIINRIKMENWTSSSKIELLVHELHKLRSDNASHKSIIFSQFTTMLQLIEWRLRRAGITTVMLDGSMTPAQRQASIEHFMNNVGVECFLVSLKAGGVALNLTEASRVFIVDPWWNPAAEWQSADRCHRIGQTRPCTITRLCIEDSVESRMVLIQEKKTSMIHSTVNSDDKAMDTLSPEDMQFLFRGS